MYDVSKKKSRGVDGVTNNDNGEQSEKSGEEEEEIGRGNQPGGTDMKRKASYFSDLSMYTKLGHRTRSRKLRYRNIVDDLVSISKQ